MAKVDAAVKPALREPHINAFVWGLGLCFALDPSQQFCRMCKHRKVHETQGLNQTAVP
jgi:hypothetical protein